MKIEFFQPDGGYFKFAAQVGTAYVYAQSEREMRRKIRRILRAEAVRVELEKEFGSDS